MKKRNIVLIGPMGTGKSRAARILADGLGWQLADTDRIMEKETGIRIMKQIAITTNSIIIGILMILFLLPCIL